MGGCLLFIHHRWLSSKLYYFLKWWTRLVVINKGDVQDLLTKYPSKYNNIDGQLMIGNGHDLSKNWQLECQRQLWATKYVKVVIPISTDTYNTCQNFVFLSLNSRVLIKVIYCTSFSFIWMKHFLFKSCSVTHGLAYISNALKNRRIWRKIYVEERANR